MTHRHFWHTNYAKNYCNRTLIVKVIAENVVTFFGTQCTCEFGPTKIAFFRRLYFGPWGALTREIVGSLGGRYYTRYRLTNSC